MNHGYFPQDHSDCDARIAELEARWSGGECCQDCPCHGYELGEYTSESIHPELEHRQAARIAELEAELEQSQACELDVNRAMRKRLAAVIALCDVTPFPDHPLVQMTLNRVRAAAKGVQ